ncbi:prenyltransferase/squalene oxidase repeat-containing protein [Clostridium sp. ATCC 25772]|uniref:prenyltransferase/squalene oxidase repeat-containing protein n=1 Tax=Clostridium sp. ATCC 25772 TaxID=1676991 RepID=UPI0007859BE1|nr:prenyltransferase/squalene oxidase repeat-containing protein [Clostridium sp. ATCC 25772]
MKSKKILSALILSTIIFTSKANAIDIDAQTNDLKKVWTIKFNKELNYNDLINDNITITDNDGNKVSTKIILKEGDTLNILPPEEGYKDGQVYKLNINENVESKNLKGIKSPKDFTFKVDTTTKSFNNGSYKYKDLIEKTLEDGCNYILNKGIDTDWEIIALVKNNKDIKNEYLETIREKINDDQLIQPTDYQRTVMTLSALNESPLNFENINFIEKICNNEDTISQGPNAVIFALTALDTKNYSIPENSYFTRESLVDTLLKMKTDDGGWDFAGVKADPDMTGMAITALSNYKDDAKVKNSIDNAINLLSNMQNENGTMSSFKIENSESISQTIIGLCANGIDPTSKEFTKGGKNLIDALLTFKTSENGFSHIHNGRANEKATEQALLALESYRELKNGRNHIYKF